MIGRHRLPRGLAAASLALALGLGLHATALQAQSAADEPKRAASVEDLLDALDAGPRTRAFNRTQPPDRSTNRCAGARAAAGKPAGGDAAGGAGSRTLVVEYAGDTAPGVQLDIAFETGSDRLAGRDSALLNNLAKALNHERLAGLRFTVSGHTDSTGKNDINLELSCARALAVQAYLVRRGVAAERMSSYGFGSNLPLPGTPAEAGKNRRVEIRLEP